MLDRRKAAKKKYKLYYKPLKRKMVKTTAKKTSGKYRQTTSRRNHPKA